MSIKRILSVLVCAVVLLSCSLTTVSADETTPTTAANTVTSDDLFSATSKTFILHMSEVQGYVKTEPTKLTLWENPILAAGQGGIVCDMIVKNDGSIASDLVMNPVPLPYDDAEHMAYLNHLMLTITDTQTGTVLFRNSYAHINDLVTNDLATSGFALAYQNMQPGETHTYQIEMHCRYTYEGTVPVDLQMPWSFAAQTETTLSKGGNGLPEWAKISLIGLGATLGTIALIVIIRVVGDKVKKRKNPVDND